MHMSYDLKMNLNLKCFRLIIMYIEKFSGMRLTFKSFYKIKSFKYLLYIDIGYVCILIL